MKCSSDIKIGFGGVAPVVQLLQNVLINIGISIYPGTTVRSNTRNVQPSVTPSAAPQLKHRLCPHEGI